MTARINLHATVLVVGRCGILIRGASGSGKSSLALRLIDHAAAHGRFATLVADDQVWLERFGERLVATAPATIAGLVEIRGLGPTTIRHEACAIVDRVVTLAGTDEASRVADDATVELLDVAQPALVVAEKGDLAVRAVMAWLDRDSAP